MNSCLDDYALASDQTANPILVFHQHGINKRQAVSSLSHDEQISL